MTTAQTAEKQDYTADWLAWISENLLRGSDQADMIEQMVAAGLDRGLCERSVAEAAEHPYIAGARRVRAANGAPTDAPVSDARTKKYAWFLEVARRNAQQGAQYGTVPRVHKPSAEEFRDQFYSQNKPVIIEGALDDWPALEKWKSPAYLKEKCGDAIVEVQANRNSDANYELNSTKLKKEITFGEFVDIVEGAGETNDWYMTANNSGRNLEALVPFREDWSFPEYLTNEPERGFFWYGPKGIVTPIHHDLTNNFMAQVRGRKLVRIIAPFESAYVYNNVHCFSPVDLFDIDYDEFPLMRNVQVIDVELGPGDLFFLPVGWWHAVRGLDISMTLTFTNFIFENDFFSFYETTGAI